MNVLYRFWYGRRQWCSCGEMRIVDGHRVSLGGISHGLSSCLPLTYGRPL